jgi:tetratricopeptide (TPR) repeat protein
MIPFKKLPLVLTLAVLVGSTNVYAQGRAGGEDEEAEGPDTSISEATARILSEAIEFLNMDQYAEARASLADLRLDRLSPFERSRYEQLMFNLDMVNEDYPSARGHLQAAIDSGGLNPQEISTMRYQMAQLFVQEEKYPEAAAALEAWLATEPNPNSAAYYLLAASYYYQELYDKALPNAQKAVELAGDAPQEGWLSMLSSLLILKEDYAGAIPVVKRMVNLFPDKKTHWQQLSQLYIQTEDYKTGLVVMEFANHGGMLTEDREIRQLSDLYMMQEMPYRSAILLETSLADAKIEKNLRAYESLANAWIASREFEKAVPVLGEAAELSDNGALYERMGQVLQQLEDWEGSVDAFENAIEKGGLRDTAEVQYLIGYSLFNMERYNDARTYLTRSANSDEHRQNSNSLLQLIDSKTN